MSERCSETQVFILPRIGIEPTTACLPCKCSTTELSGQAILSIRMKDDIKAKGRRQKAKWKTNISPYLFAFWLLPFAFPSPLILSIMYFPRQIWTSASPWAILQPSWLCNSKAVSLDNLIKKSNNNRSYVAQNWSRGSYRCRIQRILSLAENNACFGEVIGRHFDCHFIPNQNTDIFHPHFPT